MSGGLENTTKESLEDKAESLGLVCFFPLPNELQIDLDNGALMTSLASCLSSNGFNIVSTLTTISKNRGEHVYLKLGVEISDTERIILQACLGSDRKREFLGYIRLAANAQPSCMFETPLQAKKVERWRTKHK